MEQVKKCRICGGTASGFNYERLSCESCKVFFCRNYSRLETLKCKYSGDCQITLSTRKKCPKCRLVKCLAVGMKKIEEERKDGNQSSDLIEITDANRVELMLEISILKHISSGDIQQIADYVSNEFDSNIQQINSKRRPLTELSPYELTQIVDARIALSIFRDESSVNVIRQTITNTQELVGCPLLHNMLYYKKTINFCQNFAAFNSASADDQLVLLKSAFFNLMEIRFTFQYNIGRNGIPMFSDETETEIVYVGKEMDLSYQNQEVVRNMMKFSNCLYKAMDNDINIRDLLSALVLFKTQHNLSCPENIRYYYYLYCTILRRYLLCKHRNKKKANCKYLSLMRLIDLMDIHTGEHRKMLAVEFGLQKISPIVRELFELDV